MTTYEMPVRESHAISHSHYELNLIQLSPKPGMMRANQSTILTEISPSTEYSQGKAWTYQHLGAELAMSHYIYF